MNDKKPSLTRRDFLQKTAFGGAAVVGGLALPGCGNPVDAPPVIENIEVRDDPTDTATEGTIALNLKQIGDLVAVGGAVTLHLLPLENPGRQRPFKLPNPPHLLVVHRAHIGDGEDEYIAVDSACPHAGCPLGYAAQLDTIACPCHASRFRAVPEAMVPAGEFSCVGEVLHGPAKQNVTPYQARLADDLKTLVIDLRVSNTCGTLRLPPVVGGKVALPLSQFPALAMVGGSIVGIPGGAPDPIAVVRVGAGMDASAFSAVSAVCTHLGCTVAYAQPGEAATCGVMPGGGFWCACHCSQFTVDGGVIGGPALGPLPKYPVAFDGTTVTISLA
jgi:cytochrome b6-f complex iron-sulfur subunit